jgi:signal peptidase I
MIGRAYVSAVVLCTMLALGGCGGSGDVSQIQASFAQWLRALQQRDPQGACNGMTPAFWSALASQANSGLAASGQSLLASDCQVGLRQLFKLAGHGAVAKSGATVSDVVVHGNSATARTSSSSAAGDPARFVKLNGRWRIDCCIGRQLDRQPRVQYRVPSGSMMPTLHVGETIVSDNAALRAHPPPLGAIVVFHPPTGADASVPECGSPHEGVNFPQPCGVPTPRESAQTFIKRVVGLPGDTIAIVNGTVIRNGKPEPRTYHVEPCGNGPLCNFPTPVTIPHNEYFVLGDNLPASDDSRFWGPVKRNWLIGLVKAP